MAKARAVYGQLVIEVDPPMTLQEARAALESSWNFCVAFSGHEILEERETKVRVVRGRRVSGSVS